MITGGYNLAVCIGANRLGYMMKRILVNGGGGGLGGGGGAGVGDGGPAPVLKLRQD